MDTQDFSPEAMTSGPSVDKNAPSSSEIATFDLEAHACYWKGKRQRAVGTILKAAARAFNPWAKDEITPEARARMDRGSTVHETLELFDKGNLGGFDPALQGYMDAWALAKRELKIEKFDAIEEPKFSATHGYWGILDRLSAGCVYELKTGDAKPSSYRVQTAAYCTLWGVDRGIVVYVNADGTYATEKVTQEDFAAWGMALSLAKRGY